MFDTHCHLQFGAFDKNLERVVDNAKKAGVSYIVIPGTDVETSKKAVEIASKFENVFAAVGIHPHHVFFHQVQNDRNVILGIPTLRRETPESDSGQARMTKEIREIEQLLDNKKVVAVGEIGVDRHYYEKTKYSDYQITEEFIKLQKEVLKKQIELAIKYKKSLILHNRKAVGDLLEVVEGAWTDNFKEKTVFHCCEPEQKLLDFAKKHKIFIGVDGDVTYDKKKQEFVKAVPLELLVLETDSPFLIPEPLRSHPDVTSGPNEPKNIKLIAEFIAKLKGITFEKLIKATTANAKKLFALQS